MLLNVTNFVKTTSIIVLRVSILHFFFISSINAINLRSLRYYIICLGLVYW